MKKLILPVFILAFLFLNITVSAWWNSTYLYRYPIYSNATIANIPISVNDTYGINGNIIWIQNCTEQCYVYCNVSGCGSGLIAIGNDTDEKNWENETSLTARTGANVSGVWTGATSIWHMYADQGDGANDSTIYGNNGTLLDNTQWNSSGVFGYGITLDGNGDGINVSDSASLSALSPLTLEIWYRSTDAVNNHPLITKSDQTSDREWDFFIEPVAPRITCYIRDDTAGAYIGRRNLSIPSIIDGNWHHLACVWNGSTKADSVKIYMDGDRIDTVSDSGAVFVNIDDTNSRVQIGIDKSVAGSFQLVGDLDEARIWEAELSQTQIRERYYQGINNLSSLGTGERFALNISIDNPTNTTYYNVYSLNLNVSNYTAIDTWWYSLNGASNVSFTPDTTFIPLLGSQNITVWANDTSGNWYNATVWFTLDFICTGSYIGANVSYRCMGSSMNYLAPCRRFGYDTFQWDTTNMTLCEYGCRNGVCLNVTYKTCHNRCNVNETVCTSDNRYSVPCKNHTQTGCFDWDYENRTYCDNGCFNGQCIDKIHFCSLGETRCDENFVVYCDDDNSDGYYEWSEYNRTTCEYRCQQDYNLTSQLWNASCHYHSYTTPELIFSRFEFLSNMGTAMFVNPFLQMAIVLIVAIIISILASVIGSWRMGVPAFFGIMLLGTIGGWMPWYITFIMIILGGLVVFKGGIS